MNNESYESSYNQIFPKVAGLTTIGSIGFGAYKYNTDNNFKKTVNTFFEKHISKIERDPRSQMQKGIDLAHQAIKKGEAKASVINSILRKKRLEDSALADFSKYRFSSFDQWANKLTMKGSEDIVDITGNKIAEAIEEKFLSRLGVSKEAVLDRGMEGTNLVLNVLTNSGKERFTLPMFKREGKTWINKGATSTSVGKLQNVPTRTATGKIVNRIVDPNTSLLMALDEERRLDYYIALSKGGKDAKTHARDVLTKPTKELGTEYQRQSYELKRFLNTFKQMGSEPIAGFNIEKEVALKGYEIMLDPVAANDIGSVNIAGGNLSGIGKKSVTKDSLTGVAESYIDVRLGKSKLFFGKYNTKSGVLEAVHNNMSLDQAIWLRQIQSNISSNLSQGQVGDGTASYFKGFADMSAAESLKSIKGYEFVTDPRHIKYTRINRNAKKYNMSSRTNPIYELPNLPFEETVAMEGIVAKGTINLPMQISPFSSDAIKLSKKIKKMQITKGINIPLNEFVIETPDTKNNALANVLGNMLNDSEYDIPDGLEFILEKGDIIGRRKKTQNLKNAEEYALSKSSGEMDVVTATSRMRVTSNHLKMMKDRNSKRIEGSPMVMYADYIDDQIKGGSPFGSTRGSIARFKPAIGASSNLSIAPEAEMSFDLFKNIIPSFTSSANIYNKGRGEYGSMLRSWTLGNIHMSNTEMLAQGEVKDLFLKYTNIADLYNEHEKKSLSLLQNQDTINISKAQKQFGGLTFKRTENLAENNLALQRLVAITGMAHEDVVNVGNAEAKYILSSISNDEAESYISNRFKAMNAVSKFTSDMIDNKELSDLPELIQKDIAEGKYSLNDIVHNKLNFFGTYAPHEAANMTLGRGEGIFRIKGMDLSYMFSNPAALEEMAISNQVQSIKMTRETEMMTRSLSDKFDTKTIEEFEKATGEKLKIVSQEELREYLGPYLSTSSEVSQSIKSPEVFFSSAFGKDNTNGFLVPTAGRDGAMSHMYVPSSEWFGGMMQLPDGSYVPAKDDTYAIARGLASAAETDGVLKGRVLDDITKQAGDSFVSNMKASSMQVEGRMYEKLIDSQFLLDTHKTLSNMENKEAKELDYIMGNVLLSSPDEYKSNMARKIENAIAVGNENNLTMTQSLDSIYGEDNQISEYIKRTGSYDDNALQIAEGLTEESKSSWKEIQAVINGAEEITEGKVSEIKNLLFNNGTAELFTRYPVIYPGSSLTTMGFVSDELEGRTLAAGHIVKAIANADTDGDAIHRFMNVMSASRQEAQQHMMRENRISYDFMTQASENKILKGMLGKSEFGAMTEDMATTYNKFISMLELEGVEAAKLTKGVTGISQVRAWEQQGYYHEMLSKNNMLSEEAALEGRTFIDTIITKSGPQSIISSKLSKAMEDKNTREAVSSIASVFDNIGDISSESIDRSIGALGEVHTLVEQAINEVRRPGNEKLFGELNKDGLIDDAISMYDMQWNWRKLEDDKRIESIYKRGWLTQEGEDLPSFKARLAEQQANVQFFTDMPKLKETGLVNAEHYMDFLQEPLKHGRQTSESISSVRLAAKAMLDKASERGSEQFDETINRVANRMALEGSRRKSLGLDAFREEYKRYSASSEKRVYPLVDKVLNTIKEHMTPKNIAIGAGIALGGFAALNLITGDGAPEELNDLPSYNNPTFSNNRYAGMPQQGVMEGSHNANIASGLLTSQGADRGFLMNHINGIVGSRGYNSSTIISDGASPYKQDMYTHGA